MENPSRTRRTKGERGRNIYSRFVGKLQIVHGSFLVIRNVLCYIRNTYLNRPGEEQSSWIIKEITIRTAKGAARKKV